MESFVAFDRGIQPIIAACTILSGSLIPILFACHCNVKISIIFKEVQYINSNTPPNKGFYLTTNMGILFAALALINLIIFRRWRLGKLKKDTEKLLDDHDKRKTSVHVKEFEEALLCYVDDVIDSEVALREGCESVENILPEHMSARAKYKYYAGPTADQKLKKRFDMAAMKSTIGDAPSEYDTQLKDASNSQQSHTYEKKRKPKFKLPAAKRARFDLKTDSDEK